MRSIPVLTLSALLCWAALLCCPLTASVAPALTLAADGQPRAVIVLPGRPSGAAREGAAILSDHLHQICGGQFMTINENSLSDVAVKEGRLIAGGVSDPIKVFILVGEGKLAKLLGATSEKLGPGGTLIRTCPNALVLLGPDDRTPSDPNGTRYAVTLFLEQALGCRYLWPGEEGKVVPQRKSIEIASRNQTFTPRIRQRRIRAGGYGDRMNEGARRLGLTEADYRRVQAIVKATKSRDGGWFGWHRLGGSLRLRSGHAFGHLWKTYGRDHPEWFAMQPNGSRDQSQSPDRSRLCVSNVELVDAIAKEKIATLRREGPRSVSIGPNDGGRTSFCTCPKCEKLDSPRGRKITMVDFSPGANRRQFEHVSLTDRYVHFWNGIAERVTKAHPDAWLTADAYSVYSAPPVSRRLHPNIAIRFVGISYTDEEKRKRDRADWDAWARAASKIYFRPNLLLAGRRQGTPAVYVHKLADDFRYIAHHSMIGTDFDSCVHNWATQGLNYYVCAALHWDPDRDVDALIDDYCRSGFQSGAKPVKKYLLRLEDLTNQVAAEKLSLTEPYTPEVIDELRGHLTQAAAATRDEPAAHRRVAFLRSGLEYTDAYSAVFRTIREYQASKSRLTPEWRGRFRKAMDRNWLVSRDIFENHHLAVNVACVAWGSWSYFNRFGWNGPSEETKKEKGKRQIPR